jgi:hypothetical protein
MDKVIQEGIRRILESIYEPQFEKMNRSFGFRPNKGVHDAIYGISRRDNWGMDMAIEGDIKSAYDKVNRRKLMEILSEEIEDQQFLGLIKKRLQYTFFDTYKRKYITEKEGIPQGGIDSPYLWNIYMLKLDKFVTAYMNNLIDKKNRKMKVGRHKKTSDNQERKVKIIRNDYFTKSYHKIRNDRKAIVKKLKTLNKGVISDKDWRTITKYVGRNKEEKTLKNIKEIKYDLIKQIRLIRHARNKMSTMLPKRSILKYHYTRYADDWILLGNFDKALAERIKQDIKEYLEK